MTRADHRPPSRSPDWLHGHIGRILASHPVAECAGSAIGQSRENRTVIAFRFGSGNIRISLLGGCHADEPVGPLMLRHLAAYLSQLPPNDRLLADYNWWIVPHINPDGRERNRSWQHDGKDRFDIVKYLLQAVREQPGDDLEFGFPKTSEDRAARPETRAVYDWWLTTPHPFSLHVSLHGMAFGGGPWFLLEPAWRDRCGRLKERCVAGVQSLGYELHDVERLGEKGFFRISRGFATRPDSRLMRQFFLDRGDPETAAKFRPSSMETVRSLGGDPLTLVSEMPLFITPGVGRELGPPDPIAATWKERTAEWRLRLAAEDVDAAVRAEAADSGLVPMPLRDQIELQLTLLMAGIEQVEEAGERRE